jgi:hypothetical protein
VHKPLFDLSCTPLRQHRICAYGARLPEPKTLIKAYEEANLIYYKYYSDKRVQKYWRLAGFDRRFAFHGGSTIQFMVRSPELPFFGRETSRICSDTPIVYWSHCMETGPTAFRFFLNGQEFEPHALPQGYSQQFEQLRERKSGIHPERSTVENFF